MIDELDDNVASAFPKLSWEMGPDPTGGWYFALSPNLDRTMASAAAEAIAHAPKLQEWTFYATRQRKVLAGRFELSTPTGAIEIDSSEWSYVLLVYPDGEREIFLIAEDAERFGKDERWQAAAVVVESLLGEKCILDHTVTFTLNTIPEPQFAGKEKSIRNLPRAFGFT